MRLALSTALALGSLTLGVVAVPPATAVTVSDAVFADDMNRVDPSGLGSSPHGGAYTLSNPRAFSVDGSVARATVTIPGTSVSATPTAVDIADASQSVVFTVPRLPGFGRGVYLALQSRKSAAGFYQVQVVIDPRGSAIVEVLRATARGQVSLARTAIPRPVTAGTPVLLTTKTRGSNAVAIDAEVTVGGSSASLSVTDAAANRIVSPGRVAVRGYVSSSSPAQSFAFDDYRVTSVGAAPTTPAPTPPRRRSRRRPRRRPRPRPRRRQPPR